MPDVDEIVQANKQVKQDRRRWGYTNSDTPTRWRMEKCSGYFNLKEKRSQDLENYKLISL